MEDNLPRRYVTIDVTHYDVGLLTYALRRDGYTPLAHDIQADYAEPTTYVGKHRPEQVTA